MIKEHVAGLVDVIAESERSIEAMNNKIKLTMKKRDEHQQVLSFFTEHCKKECPESYRKFYSMIDDLRAKWGMCG